MSSAQVAFWEKSLLKMTQSEEWKAALGKFVQEPAFMGSADLRRFLDAQALELKGILVGLGMFKQ
jgi:tripartite-type tricarboxylate transporter receptor subunit TctC